METTEGGIILEGDEVDELIIDLVPIRELVGRTIVEVREITGYRFFGFRPPDDGTWPVVLELDDGTLSRVIVETPKRSIHTSCPAEILVTSGVVDRKRLNDWKAGRIKAEETRQEIEALKKQRLELISKLDQRLPKFKQYRGLLKQIKGVEERLISLGYKFPK